MYLPRDEKDVSVNVLFLFERGELRAMILQQDDRAQAVVVVLADKLLGLFFTLSK